MEERGNAGVAEVNQHPPARMGAAACETARTRRVRLLQSAGPSMSPKRDEREAAGQGSDVRREGPQANVF